MGPTVGSLPSKALRWGHEGSGEALKVCTVFVNESVGRFKAVRRKERTDSFGDGGLGSVDIANSNWTATEGRHRGYSHGSQQMF